MNRRPINLNFFTIHFPVTAWVSILHRLSGVFVFLLIPFLLWMLQESLASADRLNVLKLCLNNPLAKFTLWSFLAALMYHWVAGIRHLLMDVHIGEGKISGRVGAWFVLFLSAVLVIFAGFCIW